MTLTLEERHRILLNHVAFIEQFGWEATEGEADLLRVRMAQRRQLNGSTSRDTPGIDFRDKIVWVDESGTVHVTTVDD